MSKKNIKRKPDIFRIAICGIGAVIVIVLAVIIVAISVKEPEKEPVEDLAGIETETFESESGSEDTNASESVEASAEPSEETVAEEATTEESATEEVITEEVATEEVATEETAAIIANWETIPAGTVIEAANVDFNNLSQYFVAYEISDTVYNYINGRSYQENPYVGLDDLRYVKLLHYNFNHELQVGELIVAADLQSDFIGIFTELFLAEYEIQSMYLPDRYWTGDPTTTDSASIDVNNSSCFMYRPATGSGNLSKHAYGYAIDINPQQNPYVSYTSGSPVWEHENANDYIDRTTGLPHVITEEDICYQIFVKYGFTWGGAWNNIKDYQHFQK